MTKATAVDLLWARVYCPICTHMVEAQVQPLDPEWSQKFVIRKGQKCRRCWTSLDAASMVEVLDGEPAGAPVEEHKHLPARTQRRRRIAA